MKKISTLLLLAFTTCSSLTFAQSSGDIIFTEVMQNPSCVSDINGEYFEIYNTTSNPIDLNGWTIKDNGTDNNTISGSLIIPANGFLVFAENSDTATNGGVAVDYVLGASTLGNTDDELILLDTSGMVIDSIAWDGGPTWPDPNGAAMVFTGSPTDDNNNGANWAEATVRESKFTGSCTDFGSPGTEGSDQNLTTVTSSGTISTPNSIVYPNPSDGSFLINFGTEQAATITIVDILGNTMYSNAVNHSESYTIHASLAAGIYLLNIDSEAGQEVIRLIIE